MVTDALDDARTLVEQGDTKAALKLMEQVRTESVAGERLSALEEVLALAAMIHRQTTGKRQSEAGRLAFSVQQDVRSLRRAWAEAEGREWVDPYPPAAKVVFEPGRLHALGRLFEFREEAPPPLWRALFVSFLFCAGLALAGVLGAPSDRGFLLWTAGCAGYWLVFAVLQTWWWRRGYRGFWRPVYPTALLLGVCAALITCPCCSFRASGAGCGRT